MELLKLIKTSPNGEKAFYILNAEINNNKYEITLAVEKGIIGQRKRVKFRYLILNISPYKPHTLGYNTSIFI